MTILNGTKNIIYWDGEPLYPLDFKLTKQITPMTLNGVDIDAIVAYGFHYNGNVDLSKVDYIIIDNILLCKAIKGPRLILKTNDKYILL